MPTDNNAALTQTAMEALLDGSRATTRASLACLGVAYLADHAQDLDLHHAATQARVKAARAAALIQEAHAHLEGALTAAALSTGRLDRGRC